MPKRQDTGATKAPALTKEAVVAAALAQIDLHGLPEFSLRTLAQALGVYPTAIYWYLPSRNAILAEVVALVTADMVPVAAQDWQDWLRQLFRACRRAIAAHPHVAPLLGAQLVSNTTANLSLVEGVMVALDEAGFRGKRLISAYNTVLAGMVGFVTQEFAPLPDDAAKWQQDVQARVASLRGGAYPMIDANLDKLANKAFILRWQNGMEAPLDDGFAFYVEVVIAGLEALRRA